MYQLAFKPVIAGDVQARIIQISGHSGVVKNICHLAFDRALHVSMQEYNIGDDAPVHAAAFAYDHDIGLNLAGDIAVNLNGMVRLYIAVQLTPCSDYGRALLIFRICKCEHFSFLFFLWPSRLRNADGVIHLLL
jgi:hypothetical protein